MGRCLTKDPADRYASTQDLAQELKTVRDHLTEMSGASAAVLAVATPRRRIAALMGVATAILLALGWADWRLRRADSFWENPLRDALFTRLTDWEGQALDAAISADGRFVAFLSDRDGPFDAWITQIGSGEFRNLTKGQFPDLLNEEIRNIGFSDDDAHVWIRVVRKSPFGALLKMDVWFIPTMGGVARPFLEGGTMAVWSPDRSRIAYQTPDPGDPIFVADRNGRNPKEIFIDKPGIHC